MKSEIGKTYLNGIPHGENEISFQHPAMKGSYGNVAQEIKSLGLKNPNSSETASLVYDAFQNKEGKFESEIINILENNGLWEFTGNLYLPKGKGDFQNGVILQHNPNVENGRIVMNKNSLVKKLEDKDSNVKFVPFGYKIGKQTALELSKNPYIIARYREEGAEKIAKIADEYKYDPKLWSFNSVDQEETRVSALGGDWDSDRGLHVSGDYFDGGSYGHAFGIRTAK